MQIAVHGVRLTTSEPDRGITSSIAVESRVGKVLKCVEDKTSVIKNARSLWQPWSPGVDASVQRADSESTLKAGDLPSSLKLGYYKILWSSNWWLNILLLYKYFFYLYYCWQAIYHIITNTLYGLMKYSNILQNILQIQCLLITYRHDMKFKSQQRTAGQNGGTYNTATDGAIINCKCMLLYPCTYSTAGHTAYRSQRGSLGESLMALHAVSIVHICRWWNNDISDIF